jgi:hypothetical protein
MLYLIFTGGVENTGPLWVFIVAPVSVFIQALKRGLLDIAIFVTICITIMIMQIQFIMLPTALSLNYAYLYSFLTVTFLSALYEYSEINIISKH